MPRSRTRAGHALAGTLAAVVVAAVLVGVPVLLARLGGDPLPRHVPSWPAVRDGLLHQDLTGTLFIRTLDVVGWLAWACFALAIVVEVVARLRRRRAVRLPGLGAPQRWAAGLVAAIALTFASPAMADAHVPRAPAVAAPAPGGATAATYGGRLTVALPADPGRSSTPATAGAHGDRAAGRMVYRVRHGDYLGVIAERFGFDFDTATKIAKANHIADPNLIEPGWRITLPAGAADQGARTHATGHVVSPAAGAPGGSGPTQPGSPGPTAPPTAPSRGAPAPVPAPTAPAPGASQAGADRAAGAQHASPGSSVGDTALEALEVSGTLAAVVALALLLTRRRDRREQRPDQPAGTPGPTPAFPAGGGQALFTPGSGASGAGAPAGPPDGFVGYAEAFPYPAGPDPDWARAADGFGVYGDEYTPGFASEPAGRDAFRVPPPGAGVPHAPVPSPRAADYPPAPGSAGPASGRSAGAAGAPFPAPPPDPAPAAAGAVAMPAATARDGAAAAHDRGPAATGSSSGAAFVAAPVDDAALAAVAPPRLMAPTRAADIVRLDTSLRLLGDQVQAWPVTDVPQVAGVWLDRGTTTLLLADECAPAPAPWIEDPNGWLLPADVRIGRAGDQLAPLPALCTVGGRTGQHVLLDLEYLRVLGIGGDPTEAMNLLRFIAVELCHNVWSDDVRVTLAGFGAEGPHLAAIDPARFRLRASAAEAITAFAAQHANAVADLDDVRAPEVLLLANPTRADQHALARLEEDLVAAPGVGMAVVVAPTPEGMAVGRYQMAVGVAGDLRVGFLGDAVMPAASLPSALVAQVAALIAAARAAGDTSPLDLARAASLASLAAAAVTRAHLAGQHRRDAPGGRGYRRELEELTRQRQTRAAGVGGAA